MADVWAEINMEAPPEEDALPRKGRTPIDVQSLPGYRQALDIIKDLAVWEVTYPGKKYNSDEMETKRVHATFFSAIAIYEDGVAMIKLVGTLKSTWVPKDPSKPGPQPYDTTLALHRIDSIMREKGTVVLAELPAGIVRLWPGPKVKGLMPRKVAEALVPACLHDGWLLERPLEVLV